MSDEERIPPIPPPVLPHRRIPTHVSFEDRDNFVRNLVTVLGFGGEFVTVPTAEGRITSPLSVAVTGDPVLTLDEVKHHLRIELDQTDDDVYLAVMEKAARLKVQNDIRRDVDAGVGENVKIAMLLLIAHWFRNRESASPEQLKETPLAYQALIFAERDFPPNIY